MSYNKYNTRNSGRFNKPGTFVTAGTLGDGGRDGYGNMGPPPLPMNAIFNKPYTQSTNFNNSPVSNPQVPFPMQPSPMKMNAREESEMKSDTDGLDVSGSDGAPSRPHWMKSKLAGVKKISNKERRRRQNENLRRLLTPKNALMVLNEILPGEQLANQFKVQPVTNSGTQFYKPTTGHTFCAELTVDGVLYKGFGENKLIARNHAAEQAIRDLMIKRLGRLLHDNEGDQEGNADQSAEGAESAEAEDSTVPMIQLASYALHKLFTEWEWDGHKVPHLRPQSQQTSESASESGAPKTKPAKELPSQAPSMHPCMVLAHMRPQLSYRELPSHGDSPQNMLFSMAVDVDGNTYVGTATKKKEARRLAAKAACEEIFNINFEN